MYIYLNISHFRLFLIPTDIYVSFTTGASSNISKSRQSCSELQQPPYFVHHSDSSRQMPPRIFTSVISERAVNYGELISSLSFVVAEGDYRITFRAEGYSVRRKPAL